MREILGIMLGCGLLAGMAGTGKAQDGELQTLAPLASEEGGGASSSGATAGFNGGESDAGGPGNAFGSVGDGSRGGGAGEEPASEPPSRLSEAEAVEAFDTMGGIFDEMPRSAKELDAFFVGLHEQGLDSAANWSDEQLEFRAGYVEKASQWLEEQKLIEDLPNPKTFPDGKSFNEGVSRWRRQINGRLRDVLESGEDYKSEQYYANRARGMTDLIGALRDGGRQYHQEELRPAAPVHNVLGGQRWRDGKRDWQVELDEEFQQNDRLAASGHGKLSRIAASVLLPASVNANSMNMDNALFALGGARTMRGVNTGRGPAGAPSTGARPVVSRAPLIPGGSRSRAVQTTTPPTATPVRPAGSAGPTGSGTPRPGPLQNHLSILRQGGTRRAWVDRDGNFTFNTPQGGSVLDQTAFSIQSDSGTGFIRANPGLDPRRADVFRAIEQFNRSVSPRP